MDCFSLATQLTGWVSQAIFITVNLILFICSVIGNSLVVYLVWSKAALKSPTYLLMSFLAASDFITSLVGQSMYCVSVIIPKEDLSCVIVKALIFVNVANCTSSVLLLSLIARDRYLHVSKRQSYLDHTSNRFAIIAATACHLTGMINALLFTFDARVMKISGAVTFAVIGSSSFIVICLKSRQIMKIVKDHIRQMEANRPDTSALEHIAYMQSFKMEKSVNRSIFSIIILFFVSWTPVVILMAVFSALNFVNEPIMDEYRIAFVWGSAAVYFNGAFNNVIYSYRCDAIGREIRRVVAKIVRRANIFQSYNQQVVPERNGEPKYHHENQQSDSIP